MLHILAADRTKSNGAFTLIELAVVIAVIAILATLLTPSPYRVKPMAQSVQCLGNVRQIALAWHMYADDNHGILPPNDYPYATPYFTQSATAKAQMRNWVTGTMEQPVDSAAISELTDRVGSALAPYISNPYIYRCPADNYIDPNSHKPHVRSYSMNSAIGTIGWSSFNGGPPAGSPVQGAWLNGTSYNPSQTIWLTYGKMSSFTRPGPANTWLVMDENAYSINDATMAIAATNDGHGGGWIIDNPAGNHNNGAALAFVDGHSIIHTWQDVRTYSPQGAPGQGGSSSTSQANNLDCYYLAPITSASR